jgi:uncharacterized RDD family membrane protein YckC
LQYSNPPPPGSKSNAGLAKRLLSIVYESLLGFSVLFAASLAYILVLGAPSTPLQASAFRIALFLVLGCYFIFQWSARGQTLAMKTWRLRVETRYGETLSIPRATARYLAAWVSALCLGIGFAWALVDRNKQFFHDRICGTKIVQLPTGK